MMTDWNGYTAAVCQLCGRTINLCCSNGDAVKASNCTNCGSDALIQSCPKCDYHVGAYCKFCMKCGAALTIEAIMETNYEPPKELPQFKLGDCASCHDSDVLLTLSDDEENPLSYVCKECFLRGYA